MSYVPHQQVDPAVQAELNRITQVIEELVNWFIPVRTSAPEKPQKGQIVYADAASWDPGSGTGTYTFDGAAWNKIGTAAGGGATQLSELTDVGSVAYTNRFALMADGADFDARAITEADISNLQSYLLDAASDGKLYGRKDAAWEEVTGTGGSEFLTITEFDDTDSTYYFYGGVDAALDWKINRYHKTTFVKESADEVGNPTKTSLALAWTDRLTLSYS